jgi:hypothetical protein
MGKKHKPTTPEETLAKALDDFDPDDLERELERLAEDHRD